MNKNIVKEIFLELTDIAYDYKPVGIMVDFGIGMYADEDYEILSANIKYDGGFNHVQISLFTEKSKKDFLQNIKTYCEKAKENRSSGKVKEILELQKRIKDLKKDLNFEQIR